MALAERILQGDIRAAARLMRDIEDGLNGAVEELKLLYPHTGHAAILGITGPPGAGKSTLVDQLTAVYRRHNRRVGVVAVDPSSAFTGGAILGDRIRMNRHAEDAGVFIRSMATRGQLGGVSRATGDVVNVLDAMGTDVVIIETVGVGQDEIEIARMAHTTVVVMVPGLGDDIQAIKAGILEIGDVFVVNKADRDDAGHTVHELTARLEMNPDKNGAWQPQVLKTVASRNGGIEELFSEIEAHGAYLQRSGRMRHLLEQKDARIFLELLKERLFAEVFGHIDASGRFGELMQEIAKRENDPYSAVEEILAERFGSLSLAPAAEYNRSLGERPGEKK